MTDLYEDIDEESSSQVAGPDGTAVNEPDNSVWEEYLSDGPQESESKSNSKSSGSSDSSGSSGPDRRKGPKPNEVFGFEVQGFMGEENETGGFNPWYYPERFNISKERDTKSEADSCKGENISINKINNARIHAQGILLKERSLQRFRRLAQYRDSIVDVINPLLFNQGTVECVLKTVEFGEIVGWDPKWEQWQIDYTLDFISTGEDEATSSTGKRGIVSELGDE